VIVPDNNPNQPIESEPNTGSFSVAKPARKKVAAAAGKTANWLFVSAAVLLIFLALLLLIARIGLPWLGSYKGEIETRLSERMGSPVVIEELSMSWAHFAPRLSATGVSLNESLSRQVTLDHYLCQSGRR